MGNVFAEITVQNSGDLSRASDGRIQEKDIRSVNLTALVDTGARTLVISEEICQKLGLRIEKTRNVTLADGRKRIGKVTEPVKIHWKDRDASVNAIVLPECKTLLGVIPLEFMDLTVDPGKEQLVGIHGDEVMLNIYSFAA